MIVMDENINWMKLTHLLTIFILNLRVPFYTPTCNSKISIEFKNVHTREKQYLSPYVYCAR